LGSISGSIRIYLGFLSHRHGVQSTRAHVPTLGRGHTGMLPRVGTLSIILYTLYFILHTGMLPRVGTLSIRSIWHGHGCHGWMEDAHGSVSPDLQRHSCIRRRAQTRRGHRQQRHDAGARDAPVTRLLDTQWSTAQPLARRRVLPSALNVLKTALAAACTHVVISFEMQIADAIGVQFGVGTLGGRVVCV